MKIKSLIKPVAIGFVAYEASKIFIPHYSDIIAIGSGLYILYSIISDGDKTPFVTGIIYNKTDNKILATIKNPSKTPFAFIPQIRLKEILKPTDGMMTASTISDRTTLIGEPNIPSIIGPNETITVSCDLLIPQDMYENTDGTLSITLSFEDIKESLDRIAKAKVEEKITQIEQKTEALLPPQELKKAVVIQVLAEKTQDMPTHIAELIPPETAMSEIPRDLPSAIKIPVASSSMIDPPEGIPRLPTPQEVLNSPIPEFPKNINPPSPTDSLRYRSMPAIERRPGRYIGCSQTMLKVILSMERLRAINVGSDAI